MEKIRKKWGLRGVGGGREYRIPSQNTPNERAQVYTSNCSVYAITFSYCVDLCSFVRGYFGVGSGTHYMYSL